jgi:hypothetical protein
MTRRWLIAACLLPFLLLTGIWFSRAFWIALVLQLTLDNTALTAVNFSGLHISRQRIELAELAVDVDTPSGPLSAALAHVGIDYDWSGAKRAVVSVGDARITYGYRPSEPSKTSLEATAGGLAFPLQHLSIQHLNLIVDSPWGAAAFAGTADATLGEDGSLDARFQDERQAISLIAGSGQQTANLTVDRSQGWRVFAVHAERRNPADQHAELHADARPLLEWLAATALIPQRFKPDKALSEKLANLSGIKLKLSVDTADHFANLHSWLLLSEGDVYLASLDSSSVAPYKTIDFDAHLDLPATQAFELLKPWLPATYRAWQIKQGRLQGTARIRWQSKHGSTGIAHLKAQGLGLMINDLVVNDLDADIDVDDLLAQSARLRMTAASIEPGKSPKLRNLNFKGHHQGQILTVEQAEAAIFDGLLAVMPGTLDFSQSPLLFTLALKDVDLAALLAALNYPQLTGSGRISGTLPVSIAENAIEIQGGTLSGNQPGKLSYQGPAAEGDNLAFKALRNLVYHDLQAGLDYQPSGDYRLSLHLQGNNPDLLDGHPLAFNLNLSGKLPELLQRSLLSGDFDRSVLEQMKNRQQP